MENRFHGLYCMKCGAEHSVHAHSRCTSCGGILTATYKVGTNLNIDPNGVGIWRFAEFLPPVDKKNRVTLGEGSTPYVEAPRYAAQAGLEGVFCKLEGCNPTGSFKDRAAALGLSLVREWGKKGVFAASSGNAAAAVSAYAARAGVKCLILLRADSSLSKISQVAAFSPALLRVGGLYDSLPSLEKALATTQGCLPGWFNHFLWATYNPLLVDGFKTISYEIALGKEELPDYIFVPVAGGDLIYGVHKGFVELREMGMIHRLPKLVAVQGEGANPTVSAIENGKSLVTGTESASTIAGALRVNFGAEHAIVAVRESGGFGIAVSDNEIVDAHNEISRLEGIFCELSSATAIAAISKAVKVGRVGHEESAAAILTGAGLKDSVNTTGSTSWIPLAKDVESIPDTLRTLTHLQS